jgi:hypothetical protein
MTERGEGEGGSIGGLFLASGFQFVLYAFQDIDRANLTKEGARFAEREAVIARRDQTLRRLNAGEFFPAGHVLLAGPDGYPEPRRVEVAVTPTDFVLFEGENEISRIPRSEVMGLRLLDEHGERVSQPPTEVEEMDQRDRQYVVWLDRNAPAGRGGHVFVFHAWSVAEEARRDFERNLGGAT